MHLIFIVERCVSLLKNGGKIYQKEQPQQVIQIVEAHSESCFFIPKAFKEGLPWWCSG